MKTVTEILMVLAICGMVAGCNKTSRKVYDETPGEKQTAGIGKSVYATEEIDVDAIYEMKEPAAPAPAPAAPAPVAAAPAAAPTSAPAAVPGAVAPAPVAAIAPAPAVAAAPAATPAPSPAAAPAKASEDAAIKQALKDFISAVEKKDKKRFMELISYDKAKDEQLVTASYASLTAFIELDNAMKAKFNEGIFASIKKVAPAAAGLNSPLPTTAMIDSATVNQSGNNAGVTAKGFAQPMDMIKDGNQWKLQFAGFMKLEKANDPKQILAAIKAIGTASKIAMVAMKADKPQPEVINAFTSGLATAMMSSGAIKMPKDKPSTKDVEKIKKALPKEVGSITPQMMKKMQKLAMEGKIDQADIMKAAEIQAKMKSGVKPSEDDSKFISGLKKKYKL